MGRSNHFKAPLAVVGRSLLLLAVLLALAGNGKTAARAASEPPCSQPGWFPENIRLKDHTIFLYKDLYYLVAIDAGADNQFVYARSADLCQWEELPRILSQHPAGSWAELAIWAPFVYEEKGVYYLYYTGVTNEITQSIMLATSTDPSDPHSWKRRGLVFQPDHAGMVWEPGRWSDCRDPALIKAGKLYYLYYTGRDAGGSIVGVATSASPAGPFKDWGAIIPPFLTGIPESSTVVQYGDSYYLFYHHTDQGGVYRVGASPTGPWREPNPFKPGWAHEVWQDQSGQWFTSYLTTYTVTISPLTWDDYFNAPRPWIGKEVFHLALPLLIKSEN